MYIQICVYNKLPCFSMPCFLMLAVNRTWGMTCLTGRGGQRAKDISDDGRVCVFFACIWRTMKTSMNQNNARVGARRAQRSTFSS